MSPRQLLGSSLINVDVTASPSTSLQYIENSSPIASSLQRFCSKFMSPYPQSQRRIAASTTASTPDSKMSMSTLVSPFMLRRGTFNPFNRNLKERLEKPIVSPNVFSTVISPSQDSNEFKWTIEDLSKINPAPIEEDLHIEDQLDEQTETEIQKSIDKYFNKAPMVPSPWDCKLPTNWNSFKDVFKQEKQNIFSNEHLNSTVNSSPLPYSLDFVSRTPYQDVSTQTVLSLPPDLPENLDSLLRAYTNSLDTSSEDMNSSMNTSLRRQLFNDNYSSSISLFRVPDSPLISKCYPPVEFRTDGSPLEHFSPLDISPIVSVDKKSACNNSVTDVDMIVEDHDARKENVDPAGKLTDQVHKKCYMVFESPKGRRSQEVRQNSKPRLSRKRRSTTSHDMDTSYSYSQFTAPHNSTERTVPKLWASRESRMSVDAFSDNAVDSEDTGYATASFDKSVSTNDSVPKFNFNSWLNKFNDKVNILASTPTKEYEQCE